MPRLAANPFVYGRTVQGKQFFGRQSQRNTVLNRLRNGESTAVVGEPHIGKSSFLLHLANPQTLVDALGEEIATSITINLLDLHDLPIDYTQTRFWDDVLEPLRNKPGSATVSRYLREAQKADYERRSLEKLFGKLAEEKRTLFLLLDEFEVLLKHNGFQEGSFFAGLRKISSHVCGLVVVTASRLSIMQMNEIGRGLLDTGSPFFNTMTEVRLKPFDDDEIGALLSQPGSLFSVNQQASIQRMAGRHPFVLQAMAAAIHENPALPDAAAEICYERIAFHFADLWESMPENCRTTAVILSLMELGGRARGQEFSFGEIENNDRFGVELKQLAERGLAERIRQENHWFFDGDIFLIWRGEKWAVGTLLLAWWVRDQVVQSTVGPVQVWLAQKEYIGPLTHEHWQQLQDAWKARPDWMNDGLKKLTEIIFSHLA